MTIFYNACLILLYAIGSRKRTIYVLQQEVSIQWAALPLGRIVGIIISEIGAN